MSENKEVQNEQELSDKEIEEALNDIRETIDGQGEKPNTDVLELTDVVDGAQTEDGLQINEADLQAAVAGGQADQEEGGGSRHNDLMDEASASIDANPVDNSADMGGDPGKGTQDMSSEGLEASAAQEPETPQAETPQPETPQPETPQPETPQAEGMASDVEEIKEEVGGEVAEGMVAVEAGKEAAAEDSAADNSSDATAESLAKMSDIADNAQNVVAENEKRVNLLDENTASESKDALRDIVKMANKPNINSVKFRSGTSIEDIVSEIMRPMLQEWLNDNLAEIVKKTVEKEIRRLVPQEDEE
jgi:cell pole-organizing protein PopZ